MSARCRVCDCRVAVEDDGGFCSHYCEAQEIITLMDTGTIVELLEIRDHYRKIVAAT